MIVQSSSHFIFDPLDVSFNIVQRGGSGQQMREEISGRYDPDHSVTPLILTPTLQVKDPNHVLQDGDHSSLLMNVRWYINSELEANRITPQTDADAFTLMGDGSLMVTTNIVAGGALNLLCVCDYLDARRGEVLSFRGTIPLSCTSVSDASLTLNFDAPANMPIYPFKKNYQRTITAQLVNGTTPMDNSKAVYEWIVLNEHHPVGISDPWLVSMKQNSITIDTRFIGKINLECRAWLKSDPNLVLRAHTKIYRWYGQYRERLDIPRGQVLTPNTTACDIELKVATNKMGELASPQDFFDIVLVWRKNLPGETWKVIGYGPKKTIPVTELNPKYGVDTVFGAQIRELSELRQVRIGSNAITINGQEVYMRVPTINSDF